MAVWYGRARPAGRSPGAEARAQRKGAVARDKTHLDKVDGSVTALAKLLQCRAALQALLLEELEVLVGRRRKSEC